MARFVLSGVISTATERDVVALPVYAALLFLLCLFYPFPWTGYDR